MATTITPGIGAGCIFTQQGVGTSPGYAAIDLRRSDSLALQEGVYGASDFMVVQKGSGANMSVDVGMPAGGFALVQGDSVAGQGLYTIPVHASTINEPVAAADATNPRVDSVILEVLDNVHDASGSSLARVRVLTGTAFAGTTLASRSGAPTLPSSALLLADILVPASATSVDNTKIRDRRKFARGAYVRIVRNINDSAGSDYSTASGTANVVSATNLSPRIECSGIPLRVTLRGQSMHSVADGRTVVELRLDGSQVDGGQAATTRPTAALAGEFFEAAWNVAPAAGSHILAPYFRTPDTGTAYLMAQATQPLQMVVEELVRQNTANNSVTSG